MKKNKTYFSSVEELKKKYSKHLFRSDEEKQKGISKEKVDAISLDSSYGIILLKSHMRLEHPVKDYKPYLGNIFYVF